MAIRRAVESDVSAMARVQTASWAGTYTGLIPDSIFELMTVERRVEMYDWYMANRPERNVLLVAEAGSEVVGVAWAGPSRDEDIGADQVAELFAIYVDPAYWGAGHGKALMIHALDVMRTLGFELATLWVLDTNERGRGFYERGGWQADGAVKMDESYGDPLHEVRYRLDL